MTACKQLSIGRCPSLSLLQPVPAGVWLTDVCVCRAQELNYGQQNEDVDMIPLMLQKGYRPKGCEYQTRPLHAAATAAVVVVVVVVFLSTL